MTPKAVKRQAQLVARLEMFHNRAKWRLLVSIGQFCGKLRIVSFKFGSLGLRLQSVKQPEEEK